MGRILLVLLAILLPLAILATVSAVHWAYTGRYVDLLMPLWFVAWYAVPFLLLAIIGIRKVEPWLLAFALTALFWAYVEYDALSHWGTGRGANIGLGLIGLIAPIPIAVLTMIVAKLTDRAPATLPP